MSIDILTATADQIETVYHRLRLHIEQADRTLSPVAAGCIAAHRILESYRVAASDFIDRIDERVKAGGTVTDEEDSQYLAAQEGFRPLYLLLVKLSGFRPGDGMDEHPQASGPLDLGAAAPSALATINSALAMQPGSEEFERAATTMAREFQEASKLICAHAEQIQAQCKRLNIAYDTDGYSKSFRISMSMDYGRTHDSADEILKSFTRTAWQALVAKLGLRDLMSIKKRQEFDKQLERGDLPDITEEAITSILLGLVDQARDFAKEACREVFDYLRPGVGWRSRYKTNAKPWRVGRKVILGYAVSPAIRAGAYRVHYTKDAHMVAIDNVFHILDGKPIIRDGRPPLIAAIEASVDGRGETEYFKFACFKNQNLHLTMKRLDLVKQLNGIASGDYVLGESDE